VKTLNKKKAPLKKGPCRDGHPWPKKGSVSGSLFSDFNRPKKGSVSGSLFSDFNNSLLSATRSQRESSGELLLCRQQTRLGCK